MASASRSESASTRATSWLRPPAGSTNASWPVTPLTSPPVSSRQRNRARSWCPIAQPRQPPAPSDSERRSRSEEHTSELQSPCNLVCRLLLEKKKNPYSHHSTPL